MKKILYFFSVIVVVTITTLVANCCKEDDKKVAVTGVTLNENKLTITVGDTRSLLATVNPEDATNRNVGWHSDNKDVADVSDDGLVTAKETGTATIIVTTENGGKTATCIVTVITNAIPVTGVTLSKSTLELQAGDSETLIETITPEDATNRNISWSSDNENIADVSDDGLVTAKGAGTAVIAVTTEDGAKTATCTVNVKVSTDFVQTQGSKFVLNGGEIVFKGAGQWPSAGWTANTYSKLASIGFNSVRLYINASNATIADPGNASPSFSVIDNQIAMAKQNGMTVILNVHHSPGSGGQISDRGFFYQYGSSGKACRFLESCCRALQE